MILGVFASQIAIKSNVSVLSFIRQFVTTYLNYTRTS